MSCDCLKVGLDEQPVDGQRRGLAAAKNIREVSYSIQCIRRRAITYLVVAKPTHRPFCLLQRRSRLASLPALGVAKWHSVGRRRTWYGCVGCSEVAYRRYICEFEWSFRSGWRWIIKRKTNSAYRRVVLRVACVFTGISNFRYMVGLFDCLQ